MRVEFVTPLIVEKLPGASWRLYRRFVARVDNVDYIIPRGFVTDFASVPRAPLAFLLAGDLGHKAATLHDYLYAGKLDRKYADAAFRAALEAEGVGRVRRALMYAGVRLGGAGAWADREPPVVAPFDVDTAPPA